MRISDWSSDVCSSDLASDVAELACNKTVAATFLRAIAEGDAATCSALLDPDGSWWVLGWGEMSAANFLISLGQTIDRSSSQSMTIIGMTAEAERVDRKSTRLNSSH